MHAYITQQKWSDSAKGVKKSISSLHILMTRVHMCTWHYFFTTLEIALLVLYAYRHQIIVSGGVEVHCVHNNANNAPVKIPSVDLYKKEMFYTGAHYEKLLCIFLILLFTFLFKQEAKESFIVENRKSFQIQIIVSTHACTSSQQRSNDWSRQTDAICLHAFLSLPR